MRIKAGRGVAAQQAPQPNHLAEKDGMGAPTFFNTYANNKQSRSM